MFEYTIINKNCYYTLHKNFFFAIVDCLTSWLAPLKPFPSPPSSEVTIEVAELCPETQPHTTFTNHLYVYPQNLAFDSQKMFTRARNIACTIQLKDSDAEDAEPLVVSTMLTVLFNL